MENSFQTSFIPKKPITSNLSNKEPKGFFFFITMILLIVSIGATVGLFVYKSYLTKQKEDASAALSTVHDIFEPNKIEELSLFNKKTETAKQLLNNHVAMSPVFNLLAEITIPTIQYTKFEQETNNQESFIKIEGLASDYRSIALQADMFNNSKGHFFKNVIFSNLIKDKNNNISFNLEFQVDRQLISYSKDDGLNQDSSILPQDSSLQNLENNTQ